MEDRYEIRGKIGQGGLGSVYRAFDKKMSREVAIKRITTGSEEGLAEESKRQLLKEAGALASLQHPHIVTVHDFGSDEDGPFVVMELITGKTLDDVIAHAPLTWTDFRELALQTQEALIAAQDLDLVHSDLKPSNLMLSWLPSGKFQVKVVDFGLAVLTQSQCSKEIEAMDAVFGSIFFMPPEQFERKLLNSRSDMYSIGCVYYQALTCQYPYTGRTANEVMEAHLHHTVRPLHELRDDIPQWVCDWVMWHINRYSEDRPESARAALALFLQNDRVPNRRTSPSDESKRPKLIIPADVTEESESNSTPSEPTPSPEAARSVPEAAGTQESSIEIVTTLAATAHTQPPIPQAAFAQASLQLIEEPAVVSAPARVTTAGTSAEPVSSMSPAPLTAAAFLSEPIPTALQPETMPPQPLADAPLLPPQALVPQPEITIAATQTPDSAADRVALPIPSQSAPVLVPTPKAKIAAAAFIPLSPPLTKLPDPAPPTDSDNSEMANTATSKTRTFARPKLVLNKHSAKDRQGTSLQPTIPSSATSQSAPPSPITTPQTIPRAPTAPTTSTAPSGPPSPITTPQSIPRAPIAPATAPPTAPTTQTSAQSTQPVSPQPLQPPVGSKPSIHSTQAVTETAPGTSPNATPKPATKTQALVASPPKTSRVVAVQPTKVTTATAAIAAIPKQKRGVSTAVKGMVATVLVISILIVSWVIMERMNSNREAQILNKLITKAAQANTTELPVNRKELDILLGSAANVSFNKHRASIYKALLLAKSSDGTDIDGTITTFVTGREMLADVKETLIKDVLRMRNNPAVVPMLLKYATSTPDPKAATWSLKAIRFMAEDRHFDTLLEIIQNNTNAEVRRAAEETMSEIIRKSSAKEKLANTLSLQYTTALNHEIRHSLLRLMGICGGEKALLTVRAILAGSDEQQIIAAIIALGSWGDDTGFPVLVDFLKESRDPKMRGRAFDAAQKYLGVAKDNTNVEQHWTMLSNQAKTREEQGKILQGIANVDGEWPLKLVQTYLKSDDEEIAKKAERALVYMQDLRKLEQ